MNQREGQGQPGPLAAAVHRDVDAEEAMTAARAHWDRDAVGYLREYGADLGDEQFLWCPEGLLESHAHLLGEVAGLRVLELGCGAGQAGRWLVGEGALVLGLDISRGMLLESARLDARTGLRLPVVQAAAERLPVQSASLDLVVSAFGALPFVADIDSALSEVERVLGSGGRFVASVTHPMRWVFPDDPDAASLRVLNSYFDRTPYVEEDAAGRAIYTEHHRTVGDWVRALVGAGLEIIDLIEPQWVDGRREWGAWSAGRAALIPGSLILVTRKP